MGRAILSTCTASTPDPATGWVAVAGSGVPRRRRRSKRRCAPLTTATFASPLAARGPKPSYRRKTVPPTETRRAPTLGPFSADSIDRPIEAAGPHPETARCPTKAAARRLTLASRRSACASSGRCSRPPGAAGQLSAWRGIAAPAAARTAEAIVPAIEPDDRYWASPSGKPRSRGIEMSLKQPQDPRRGEAQKHSSRQSRRSAARPARAGRPLGPAVSE